MEDEEEVAELRIASVRGLLIVLQAIKPTSKQVPCYKSAPGLEGVRNGPPKNLPIVKALMV